MINIAIAGAAGRMGAGLVAAVAAADDMRLSLALEAEGHPALGADSGERAGVAANGVPIAAAADADFDVMIDFSAPAALAAHLELCEARGAALALGVTGLQETHHQALRDAASRLAILQAPNMSLGVNLCFKLVEQAARALAADSKVDMEVVEAHHRHKKDAPSGTALRIGEIMAEATGGKFDERRRNHQAEDGEARPDDAIGFSVIRGGELAGEHTALFISPGEELRISHRAFDRAAFISGALHAARWLKGREAGLYGMAAVLESTPL